MKYFTQTTLWTLRLYIEDKNQENVFLAVLFSLSFFFLKYNALPKSVAGSQYITEAASILRKAFRSGRGYPGGKA